MERNKKTYGEERESWMCEVERGIDRRFEAGKIGERRLSWAEDDARWAGRESEDKVAVERAGIVVKRASIY